MFAVLMLFQWLASVIVTYWITPRTWSGTQSFIHPHVWSALILGGSISLVPFTAVLLYRGHTGTRYLIAVCQVLMSALLIHLTGGRIETHFHIFGSLAFLAFYRDWRVLIPATAVVSVDHLLRGLFWPESVFGVLAADKWRWIEHTGWVLFEATFLVLAIQQSIQEMHSIAERQALAEAAEGLLREAHDQLEQRVQERTVSLQESNGRLQQQILERKRAESKILWQANHDSLTGLPNRTLFLSRLEQALANAHDTDTCLGVMFLDMDRFKQINDGLGHAAGDTLLCEVAVRLQQALRPDDTIGRIGGDEFLILLPHLSEATQAASVSQSLIDALSRPLLLSENEVFFSASIGVSLFPQDAQDAETLIKHADVAMYRLKQRGRNGYALYTDEMASDAQFTLEAELRKAILRNELILLYQPQVQLCNRCVVGVEALVRWRHPRLGLLSPSHFIPIAEETELILSLGEWVLREAARQVLLWRQAGFTFSLSVNLSARQFSQQDLVAKVSSILDETGLAPDWLDLELTESSIMTHGDSAVQTLKALKDLGVCLSVDDFGTGYSSLSYLRRFPLDVLKIDRSFIKDLDTDAVNAAIVRAIVDLAHAIGLTVIAEGVETPGQCQILQSLGCDIVQGYLFSRPLTAGELESFLTSPDRFSQVPAF